MSNELAVPAPSEDKTTARVSISKDQAASLKIGLAVRLEVVGEVKELTRCYNDKEQYEVVLEDPVVKNITENTDAPEKQDEPKDTLATMSKEDLKKLISKE